MFETISMTDSVRKQFSNDEALQAIFKLYIEPSLEKASAFLNNKSTCIITLERKWFSTYITVEDDTCVYNEESDGTIACYLRSKTKLKVSKSYTFIFSLELQALRFTNEKF